MWLRLTAKLAHAIGDEHALLLRSSRFSLVDNNLRRETSFLPREAPRWSLDGEKLSVLSPPLDRRRPEGAEKKSLVIPHKVPYAGQQQGQHHVASAVVALQCSIRNQGYI